MEDLSSWSFAGDGEMTLTTDRARDGKYALRIRSTTNVARAGGDEEWEDLVATRKFANEDWSRFNRISLWVYPDVVGAPAISCTLVLHNDGKHKLPDSYNEGRHESIILKNHEWNQIVWEIAPLARDRVTAVDFAYSLPRKIPDPGDRTSLDLDRLELQTVVPITSKAGTSPPAKSLSATAGTQWARRSRHSQRSIGPSVFTRRSTNRSGGFHKAGRRAKYSARQISDTGFF